jgi:hypothetical protein
VVRANQLVPTAPEKQSPLAAKEAKQPQQEGRQPQEEGRHPQEEGTPARLHRPHIRRAPPTGTTRPRIPLALRIPLPASQRVPQAQRAQLTPNVERNARATLQTHASISSAKSRQSLADTRRRRAPHVPQSRVARFNPPLPRRLPRLTSAAL